MNFTKLLVDLLESQQSKLRNGHSIRILPRMIGSGDDMILDPMTMNNMLKNLIIEKVLLCHYQEIKLMKTKWKELD